MAIFLFHKTLVMFVIEIEIILSSTLIWLSHWVADTQVLEPKFAAFQEVESELEGLVLKLAL